MINSIQRFGEYKTYTSYLCIYTGTGGQHSGARKLLARFKKSDFNEAWEELNKSPRISYIEESINGETYKYFTDGTGSGFSEYIRNNKGMRVYASISKESMYNQDGKTLKYPELIKEGA